MVRVAWRGTGLALASAVAFGVATPLVQRFGQGSGAFATASLLYCGAALAGLATRSRTEAPLRREHARRVLVIAVLGGVLAPAALAWGLARASGVAASLMMNLEAAFTILLARAIYGEHVGGRVGIAALLLVGGGALLAFERGTLAGGGVLGLGAIALASLGWALDSALAKPLAALDPSAVVAAKASVGALLSAVVALAFGHAWPSGLALLGLLVVGATGYGLSLRLYLAAQRALGAGRTASVFAAAPFCGAFGAWALGERAGAFAPIAGLCMIGGVVLHLTERHRHVHVHDALTHAHAHRHDDEHHVHAHHPMPEGEHTHSHEHERLSHDHEHVPDPQHAHAHAEHAREHRS